MLKAAHFLFILSLTLFSFNETKATPPTDTLVIVGNLDDIMSFDPAISSELAANEILHNVYEQLVTYDPHNPEQFVGSIADTWTMSPDGKTLTFTLKKGLTFASGNPITAEDVVYSLHRLIRINKVGADIFAQFGLTPENVTEKIVQTCPNSFEIRLDESFAPTLLLNTLTHYSASILDKKLLAAHSENGDEGQQWLGQHAAGSGPFVLTSYVPQQRILLSRNPQRQQAPGTIKKVLFRNVQDQSTQELLLKKGDADIARDLKPEAMETLKDAYVFRIPTARTRVLHLNQKVGPLAHPKVREAIKHLIDYKGIEEKIAPGTLVTCQTFLPKGFPGAIDEKPFSYNPEKAKQLLKEAGYEKGFEVTLSTIDNTTGQIFQDSFGKANIKVKVLLGDDKQVLTALRSRQHEMALAQWGADYYDPDANAMTFMRNPDNSDNTREKTLAWRNAWDIPEFTKIVNQAKREQDPHKRYALYRDLQKQYLATSPAITMFQVHRIYTLHNRVQGLKAPAPMHMPQYAHVTKQS